MAGSTVQIWRAENVEAVKKGLENLARHVENVKRFGVPPVVAINQFVADTDAELKAVSDAASSFGVDAIVCSHWADGGAGTEELARKVVELADGGSAKFAPLYPDDMTLWEKTKTIAQKIYGADDIAADQRVTDQFKQYQESGFGHFPICMAKTQYSFSSDPTLKGAPSGFTVPIREIRLSAGAEFLVAICGDVMTMPGLPRVPAANSIRINDEGVVEGLF